MKELDAMRGAAALAVVLYHYTARYTEIFNQGIDDLPLKVSWGDQGVQLFFMISGYVIFMTLDRTKKPGDFLVSRFSRLYPAYWASISSTFIVVMFFGLTGREVSSIEYLLNFTMLQGYMPNVSHVDGVYWTLTVEMTFYALMFIFYLINCLDKIRIIGAIWIIVAILNSQLVIDNSRLQLLFEMVLILKYVNLFLAGILFYQIHKGESSKVTYFLLVLCFLSSPILNENNNIFAITFYFILFVLFVNSKASFLRFSPLLFLGGISYSLYLIHQNIGYIVIREFTGFGFSIMFAINIALLVSILLAVLITYTIEQPALKMIRSYYARTVY